LEEEESASRTAGEEQLGATPPPQTEVPKVERVEGDASVASLGIMVMAQNAAFASAREAVLVGGYRIRGGHRLELRRSCPRPWFR
jgi:hypothetical protein